MNPTRDQLIQRVRSRLSETDADFFDEQSLTDFLNEGQDILCTQAPYTARAIWSLPIVIGQSSYLLPDDMLKPTNAAVWHANRTWWRYNYEEPEAFDDLASARRGNAQKGYCTYRVESDGTSISITPAPTLATDILVVRGHLRPQALDTASTRTDIPLDYAHVLVDYAFWRCKEKDEESGQAQLARQQFGEDLKAIKINRVMVQYHELNRPREQRETRSWPW